jgi:hypothetical protein
MPAIGAPGIDMPAMSPAGFDPDMSMPGIAWGAGAPGFAGEPISIPGMELGIPEGPGLAMSIPGIAPAPVGFAARFGDGRAVRRAGDGFAFLAAGLAFAAGFLAGIGMFMPGMPCIDWAEATGAASASAVPAASAARRLMPPLPSGAR